MVVKAENHVEQSDINALIKCNSAKVKFMLILLAITFAVFFVFGVIVGNKSGYPGYCMLGVAWCVVVYLYVFFINPKITYKAYKKKNSENAVIKYQFTEKSVGITIENESGKQEKRSNYRDMFRVYETPEYFFVYVKRSESYIVKKSGFIQGTAAELSEMISAENPKNFIRKVR